MSLVPLTEPLFLATVPISFGRSWEVWVYERGTYDPEAKTGTAATVYDSEAGTSELAQPLITDRSGRPRGAGETLAWLESASYDLVYANPERPDQAPFVVPWEAAKGGGGPPPAASVGVIFHGSDAGAARGTELPHYIWVGSVEPSNMDPDADLFIDTNGLSAEDIEGLGDAATLDVGTTGGTVAAGDDTRITGAQQKSEKGAANGYAGLEAAGKVPVSQLPSAIMEYQGTWNASTNSPALEDGKGSAGDVYRVSVAGERNLGSGKISFEVGDYVVYNGSVWEKSDTTDAVSSVAGKQGAVTLASTDISGLGTSATKDSGAVGEAGKVLAADDPSIATHGSVTLADEAVEKVLQEYADAADAEIEARLEEIPAFPTFVVAASNASPHVKANADFVCDGTDDHVQFNEAIAALPVFGGRIDASEGHFSIGEEIWADKDNVTILGAGKGQPLGGPNPTKGGTLFLRQAGFTGTTAIRVEPAAEDRVLFGVTLKDFSLDGMNINEGEVDGLVWKAARSTISDVWITRWSGNGMGASSHTFAVYPKASHDNIFDRVRIDDNDLNGAYLTNGCTDNYWKSCIITSNGGDGVKCSRDSEGDPSTAQMFVGNYIYSNEGRAVSGPLYQMQFVGNRIQDCNGGIDLLGAANAAGFQVVGNIIRNCSNAADNATDGIKIDSTGVCRGGIIEGNSFHTDPGDQNPSLHRMRYGINIASSKVRGVVIGPQSSGYREATSCFGTAMINDEGPTTSILNADQIKLIADQANAQGTYSSYGTGFISGMLARSARGTAEAPLRSKSADVLGRWMAAGAQASSDEAAAVFPSSARAIIEAIATEDWTSTGQGASLIFKSTTTGSLTTNEKFRLNGGEGIDFNSGSFATYMMRLKNNAVVMGRNAAGSANVSLLKINASDQLELMSDVLFTAGKKLGFFGKTPASRPNVKAASEVSAKELCEALETLGLVE